MNFESLYQSKMLSFKISTKGNVLYKVFVLVKKDSRGVVVGFTELRQMTGKRALLALLRGHREAAPKRGKTMKCSGSISTLLSIVRLLMNLSSHYSLQPSLKSTWQRPKAISIYLAFNTMKNEATNKGLLGPFPYFTENWFVNFFDQFSALLLFGQCCFLRI